jgi:heptosyltransferase I
VTQVSQHPQRLLIVRPSALGDVARTVPVLVSLKRRWPDAKIDWLVHEGFIDAIVHHPDLHEAVPFPRQQLKRSPAQVLPYMRKLRQRQYEGVYDLQGLARSGWLAWSTRAPRRVGPADARELGWLAYTHRVAVEPQVVHTVDRMLAVLRGDGIEPVCDLRLYPGPADRQWADEFLRSQALSNRPFVVVAPGAKWLSKCWPTERFDAVIEALGMPAVIVGASSERAIAGALLREGRVDLIGGTTVGRLMAVIEQSALVLANDSAPLHLAVGLGQRCVGIFGPTDPGRVGPYQYSIGVVAAEGAGGINYRAAGDDQSIIARVSIDRVVSGARQVLAAPPPRICPADSSCGPAPGVR